MTSPVMSMVTNGTDPLYNNELLRHRVEDHLDRLSRGEGAVEHVLEEQQRWRYENDLYNLLAVLGIPAYAYYATLRLNGLTHPQAFTHEMHTLLVPDEALLSRLHRLHLAYT